MEDEDEREAPGLAAAAKKLASAFGRDSGPSIGDRLMEKGERAAGVVLGVLDQIPDAGLGRRAAEALGGKPPPDLGTSRQHTSGTTGPDLRQSDAGEPAAGAAGAAAGAASKDFKGSGGFVYRRTPEGIEIVAAPGNLQHLAGLLVRPEGKNKMAYDAISAEMEGKK